MDELQTSSIREELEKAGVVVSTTAGTSMWPLLRNRRDTVVIRPNPGRLEKHQVALYLRPNGQYVLHRVLRYRDGCYIIRGDNTYVLEHIPDDGRVIGYMEYCIRGGKRIDPKSRGYRAYVVFWRAIYPLRFALVSVRRLLGRIYRAVFRKKS